MNKPLSVVIVVPRYGRSLGGGAETLLKSLADNVFSKDKINFSKIEIWTTCAIDHRTWENYYPPGSEIIDDIKVTRFRVDPRNIDKFIESELILQSGRALTLDEQFNWLNSGVNSRELYAHIAANQSQYDLFIFGPYLFPITFWGASICPEKSILLPCLHDEHYAYLDCFRELFKKVKGVFFNSLPEKDLAIKIYKLANFDKKSFEVGMGFNSLNQTLNQKCESYLLYSGRKEQGKGLDFLLSCYESLPDEIRANKLKLYLIGSGKIEFRETLPIGVIDLGFVTEERKCELMQNALALVQPSLNESFSIVMMESWLLNTPVLVRKECAVTRHHVSVSGGGLWFSDDKNFRQTAMLLLDNYNLSKELGTYGKKFVETYYSWPVVTERLNNSLRSLGF